MDPGGNAGLLRDALRLSFSLTLVAAALARARHVRFVPTSARACVRLVPSCARGIACLLLPSIGSPFSFTACALQV